MQIRSLSAAAAAGLLVLGTVVYAGLLFNGSVAPTPENALVYAASHPSAWRAAWLALVPGGAALVFAVGTWSRAVCPSAWGSLGWTLALAAWGADLLSLPPLLTVPEAGRGALDSATTLSGAATGLWGLALLLPTVHSAFARRDAGWAWCAVLANVALAVVSLTVVHSSRWGSALCFALMAVVFTVVPVLMARIAFRPPHPRRRESSG